MDPLDTETEIRRLISERPSSNMPGRIPREYLPPGEVVIFETRPSLWGFLPPAIAGALLCWIFAALFWFIAGVGSGGALTGSTAVWFVIIVAAIVIGLLVFAVPLLNWYYTSFGVTNRRILRRSGVWSRTIIDARFDKVQAVTVTETQGSRARGFGSILFSLSVGQSIGSIYSGVQHGGILWRAVPDHLRVRAFVEDVCSTFERLGTSSKMIFLEEV